MGGFHAMAVVTSFIFAPFHFQPSRISLICKRNFRISLVESTPVVFGFFSSLCHALLIKKYKLNLKKVATFNMIPVLFALASSYWIIRS